MELARDGDDVAMAHIDSDACLPFLFGEVTHATGTAKVSEAKCHGHVTSIFDVTNINLTRAQQFLKLDHDHMGHILMQSIQQLCQPLELDSPDFDGVSTSGKPCIVV